MTFTSSLFLRTFFKSRIGSKYKPYFCCKRYSSEKLSIQVFPEIEGLLESGRMKHRKHPGVFKKSPIVLPESLKEAIYKLIVNQNEKNILNKAEELLECLTCRRLPIESEEVDWRLKNILNKYEAEEEPSKLTREQQKKLKREISSEMKRWKKIEYNYNECLAYLAGRMAPNYASVLKVFSEIKDNIPSFHPKTFFDFGSGVGSAVWAAQHTWKECIEEYFCVDASPDMNNVSQALLTDDNLREMCIRNISYRQFLPASENIKYDLVVSAFSLMDLPSAMDRVRVIDVLWRKTTDVMVIIEYGNLAGYQAVLDARDYVLQIENQHNPLHSSGAHVLMPCPHTLPCPLLEKKIPCGVNVPYQTVFPRHCQEIRKDWISYVVLRKGKRNPEIRDWPRIVMPVLKRDRHLYCRVCCNDGMLKELVVTRSKDGRHAYRCARSSTMGDSLPVKVKTEKSSPEESF